MPKFMSTIPDVKQSFTRPIIFDIVRQVLENTGLPKDLKIYYPDETERSSQLDSTLEKDGDKIKFTGHDSFSVEVEEDYGPAGIIAHPTTIGVFD